MKIALKNVKIARFASEETTCFRATIYVDGRRAGEVSNGGHGGPNEYHFADRDLERRFEAFCQSQPPLPPHPDYPELGGLPMSTDLYLSLLLEQYEERKELERACKGKTAYRLKGDKPGTFWSLKAPYSARVAAHLRDKHGDRLEEIVNETLGLTA
jgi:hypothetical protein